LDVLDGEHVRATFFVQGRWATAYPNALRHIARSHVIGNHSHFHAPMPFLTDEGIVDDVNRARGVIKEVCGVDPLPLFRLPFGAGIGDARVIGVLARMNYRNVHWDVEAGDWDPAVDADIVEQRIVDGVGKRGDGAIVLLHTWPDPTSAALPSIIRRLRDVGAEFVTADRLLT
jgi:peptidoglycan-N-acetylglucosamine deacetylase